MLNILFSPTLLKPQNIDVQRLVDQLHEVHNSVIIRQLICNKISKKYRTYVTARSPRALMVPSYKIFRTYNM